MAIAAVAVAAMLGAACVGKDDSDVLYLSFSYHPGDEYIQIFRSYQHHGGQECLNDDTIHTVVMKIEGVPDPRPSGWLNAGITTSMSCDELKDWVLNVEG